MQIFFYYFNYDILTTSGIAINLREMIELLHASQYIHVYIRDIASKLSFTLNSGANRCKANFLSIEIYPIFHMFIVIYNFFLRF